MNTILKTLVRRYQDVLLVSDDGSAVEQLSDQTNVSKEHICRSGRAQFLSHCMANQSPADLLVIDVDAFGIEDGMYMLFLAQCMLVCTPVIILANDMPIAERKRFLAAGALDVLQRTGTNRVVATAPKPHLAIYNSRKVTELVSID